MISRYQKNRRKFPKKDGLHVPLRGQRLKRTRKFETRLATKSGIKVRSKYEQTTADYLYERGIHFQYEPLMLLGGKQFRPDFFLPDYNLFLEICGYGHMPNYRARQAYKENTYTKNGLKAIFIHYHGKGSLSEMLAEELSAKGIL
jgi:DNA helicase-4